MGFGVRTRRHCGLGGNAGGIALAKPSAVGGEIWSKLPLARAALNMRLRRTRRASVHENVLEGDAVDLDILPIQWCWPGEPAPLVTWPLAITQAPDDPSDINVGIYRMQKLGRNKLIMRWLAHRGGARHHRMWQQRGSICLSRLRLVPTRQQFLLRSCRCLKE